jgi:hypothetical protein
MHSPCAGRNIIARAKNGTGKTAAFCIPLLERVNPASKHIQVRCDKRGAERGDKMRCSLMEIDTNDPAPPPHLPLTLSVRLRRA